MSLIDREKALALHRRAKGKIKLSPTINVQRREDIAMAYIEGGAFAVEEVYRHRELLYDLTGKANRIAVVSDGTAVLGLGNRGPEAALPMIEGKCLLYKKLGDIDAIPLCVDCHDFDSLSTLCRSLAPTFGAVVIEDIKSPMDFELVSSLKDSMAVPLLSDDMESTSVVVLGGLLNASKMVEKDLRAMKVLILGSGTAGLGAAELLHHYGVRDIVMAHSTGILNSQEPNLKEPERRQLQWLNPRGIQGSIAEAIAGADAVVGLTGAPDILTRDHVLSMAPRPIVFALGRPVPEIALEEALAAGAAVAATSYIMHPNCLPNLLVFPGITRGLLDVRAKGINHQVLIAAAQELASLVDHRRLRRDNFVPYIFSDETTPRIAEVVAQSCIAQGLAKLELPPRQVYDQTWKRLYGRKGQWS